MTETHAHIYDDQFSKDLDHIIERSVEAGIEHIYMPNIDHRSIDPMMEVEAKYAGYCIATMGLHPCSVNKDFEKELYLVEEWLNKRTFAAVGEIGTDMYWDNTYMEQQVEAFEIQVSWARQYKLPVIIHCRESLDMTIDLVEQLKDDRLHGVFHCFGGTLEQARRICSMGFFLGLGGIITFKNSGMDKIIPHLDPDHVVLETDSPYLAPVPYRGKRNEPSYLELIVQRMAELCNISTDQVKEKTNANASRLFKAKRPK